MNDGGPSDSVAPTVTETSPADAASNIERSTDLVIRFSEPMAPDVGVVSIEPGGARRPAGGAGSSWDMAGNTLTMGFEVPLPSGEVTIRLTDFTDRAGNPLADYSFAFTTMDDVAPTVLSSTPAEGATGETARLPGITIQFSEPMRTTAGTIDILGGAATFTDGTWSADAASVTFEAGVPVVEYVAAAF